MADISLFLPSILPRAFSPPEKPPLLPLPIPTCRPCRLRRTSIVSDGLVAFPCVSALSELKWWRTRSELGSGAVTPGGGLSEEVSVEVAGGPSIREGLEQITPPAEQRIAAELQALLDAYYRSLAEKRSEQPGAGAP